MLIIYPILLIVDSRVSAWFGVVGVCFVSLVWENIRYEMAVMENVTFTGSWCGVHFQDFLFLGHIVDPFLLSKYLFLSGTF